MVRRDIGDDCYVSLEIIYVVQLETAQFQYVDVVLFCSHLICITLAYVASETDVEAGILQQVVNQRSCGGLAVASGDADLLGCIVPSCKLDFRYDSDAVFCDLPNHRSLRRNSRALYHFVSVENQFFGMSALLVWNIPFIEHSSIFLRYLTHIGEKYIITLDLCEDCGSYSAFTSAENY